jgi:hypothetical protein
MNIKTKEIIPFWSRLFRYFSKVNWAIYFIIIAVPTYILISNKNINLLLLFPILIASVITYYSIKESIVFVYGIAINDDIIVIKYLKYDKKHTWTCNIKDSKIQVRHHSPKGPTSSDRIHFLGEKRDELIMYFNGYWTIEDMKEIETKLLELGIRKPYGENL